MEDLIEWIQTKSRKQPDNYCTATAANKDKIIKEVATKNILHADGREFWLHVHFSLVFGVQAES